MERLIENGELKIENLSLPEIGCLSWCAQSKKRDELSILVIFKRPQLLPDEQFFVVPVAALFFGVGALSLSLVDHQIVEVVQVFGFLDLLG